MMALPPIPAGHLLVDQAASIAAHHVGVHKDRQGCSGVPPQELGGHNARAVLAWSRTWHHDADSFLVSPCLPPPLLSTTTSIQSRSPVPVPVMLPWRAQPRPPPSPFYPPTTTLTPSLSLSSPHDALDCAYRPQPYRGQTILARTRAAPNDSIKSVDQRLWSCSRPWST